MNTHLSNSFPNTPAPPPMPSLMHEDDSRRPTPGRTECGVLNASAAPAVPSAPLVTRRPPAGSRDSRWRRTITLASGAVLLLPTASFAQGGSPWEAAVTALSDSFTGPIARGLSLVAIVVGGIAFAFGEGGSKRLLAGIVFGAGMAIGAVNFMGWLFP